jgi:hypothetical protein
VELGVRDGVKEGVVLGVILLVGVTGGVLDGVLDGGGVWVGVGDGSKHPKASCTRPVT